MKPLVDIVVPCWNRSDMTIPCLQHFVKTTKVPFGYRIIVVDNGSTDETKSALRWFGMNCKRWVPWARYKRTAFTRIHLPSNLGFAKANNIGARRGRAKWILFMNNDAFPAGPHWLAELVGEATTRGWAAVGPTSDKVIGIQSVQWNGRWPKCHESKFLSGVCFLVRRDVFDTLGGWDEDFLNGDEDLDLSLRLRKAGHALGVCRQVFVKHESSQTLAGFVKQRGKTIQEWFAGTRDLLIFKHGPRWHSDLFFWEQFKLPREQWRKIGVLPNGRFFAFPGRKTDQSAALRGLRDRCLRTGAGPTDGGATIPGLCAGGPDADTRARAVAVRGLRARYTFSGFDGEPGTGDGDGYSARCSCDARRGRERAARVRPERAVTAQGLAAQGLAVQELALGLVGR